MRTPALTLITDETKTLDVLADIVARACSAATSGNHGAQIAVQLRAKSASGRELLLAARRLRDVTSEGRALLVVNDRIDIALAAGADGVHLPAAGIASEHARRVVGEDMLLGRSVHSLEEIERERAGGAVDYVQFGPIFATPSKVSLGQPQGLHALALAVERARPLPVIAVGGIAVLNVASVMEAGASGVAVISGVMNASDPQDAARTLLRAVRSYLPPQS